MKDDFIDLFLARKDLPNKQPIPPIEETKKDRSVWVGRTVNLITVKCLRRKPGRNGPLSTGVYEGICRCGKMVLVNYAQLYYGHVYSCGCIPRPKHPPVRLEGRGIGLLEVMRWAEEEGRWEAVCRECGAIVYALSVKDVRRLGEGCGEHGKKEYAAKSGARRG